MLSIYQYLFVKERLIKDFFGELKVSRKEINKLFSIENLLFIRKNDKGEVIVSTELPEEIDEKSVYGEIELYEGFMFMRGYFTKSWERNKEEIKMKMKFNTTKLAGVKKILAKSYQELTQEDLIDTRIFLENALTYETQGENKEEYDQVYKALSILLSSDLFRPMDARSLPEFALSILLDFLEEDETENDFVITTEIADKAFKGYFADGTMTYNTQKTLNYIRAFWSDFFRR